MMFAMDERGNPTEGNVARLLNEPLCLTLKQDIRAWVALNSACETGAMIEAAAASAKIDANKGGK